MSDAITLILDAGGTVVDAVQGPVPDGVLATGETARPRQGDEWIGWRLAGAVFVPPVPPVVESLADYCARRRWEILDEGRIAVGGASVPTDDNTQAKLTGGALKATRNPAYVIRNWKVRELTFVELDGQTIIRFADAVEERVQEMFDREAECAAGIVAGTLTTTAQAEAILAAPSQVSVS